MTRQALLLLTGAALAVTGWRKGSWGGFALFLTGAGLSVRSLAQVGVMVEELTRRRVPDPKQLETPLDPVDEASDESFPASDPPALASS